MNKPQLLKWKIAASLAFVALLTFINSASAQLTVTPSSQAGSVPFTPGWTQAADSLLANLAPTTVTGTADPYGTGGAVNNLTTAGESLEIRNFPNEGNVEIGGSQGLQSLVYTVTNGAPTYGYNITNITVYGGWVNNGRDAQTFAVYYSTVSDPTNFKPLTGSDGQILFGVDYNPAVGGGMGSATRVVINDASGGIIAPNVYALEFLFLVDGENAGAGYMAITAEGTAASSAISWPAPYLAVTTSNQVVGASTPPTWTIETDSLIAGMAPSAFTGGGFTDYGTTGTPALTDGTFGNVDNAASYCWGGSGDGAQTLTYTLTNSVNGSDLTNIVVYSGWGDANRDGQFYNISYSTVSAPLAFIPLPVQSFPIIYNPNVSGHSANRVAISTTSGAPLAKNVYAVKFDFTPQTGDLDYGFSGYAEIILEGTNSAPPTTPPSPFLTQDTTPSYAETVVGDQVIFTAAYSNTPPAALQWLVIKSGVTNIIPGATSSTLTLNNLQVTNSGTYLLKATNTTDPTALPSYSTGAPLVVSNSPAAVNNVIVNYAGQTFASSVSYFPAWPVDTNDLNLILGFQYGSGEGTLTYPTGGFGIGGCNIDPSIMSDGTAASMPTLAMTNLFCGCGESSFGAGPQVTYTLVTNSAAYGLDITNITVFGGWVSANHNEQDYQVSYSTVQSPGTFVPLAAAVYVPTDANNSPSVTRTTIVPASGVLAHNVAALQFNWSVSPTPNNGWGGYSEILVGGAPSTGFFPVLTNAITPSTASDVVGSQLIITAGFSGATSLQWKLNGTNVPGATSSTLTLNNLQLTNSGSYTLVASNASGVIQSGACAVTVNSVPLAVSNAVVSVATQTSLASQFTPTWDPLQLANSLIYNQSPSASGLGSFTTPDGNGEFAGTPAVLTDGSWGYFTGGDNSTLTCMGFNLPYPANSPPGEGNFVTYTLPVSAHGYNITNIMSSGGWVNGDRDQQAYTVYYSTVASPTYFIPLAVVNYLPSNPTGISATRATITPGSGVLASNVAAVMFNMTSPLGENGYEGYNELAVYGSPSASAPAPGPVVTVANEPVNVSPDWVAESPNLIGNQLPSSVGSGNFGQGGGSVTGLTDGTLGNNGDTSTFASCGSGGGQSVTYSCTNGTWNLTNIVLYSGWVNYNRDGQFYNVSYSTLSAPATFIPLTSIVYNPIGTNNTPSLNRVDITSSAAGNILATNVYAVRFDFTPQLNSSTTDYGWSGYSEIVLQGANLPVTAPMIASPYNVGGNLIVTGTGGTPNAAYTWLQTTNLTPPIVWTVSATGNLDGSGNLSNSIPINAAAPDTFFRLRVP